MRILLATFRRPETFLNQLDLESGDGTGALSFATKARYTRDEPVILEVGFPGLPNHILVRTRAMGPFEDEIDSDSKVLQKFALVSGEQPRRDFLIAVAAGRASASWKRRHRRFPLRMPARFVVEGEGDEAELAGDGATEDMGTGGISLRTDRSLPDGARVTVVLTPGDGSEEIEFTGHVVWNRSGDGDDADVGIQFDNLSSEPMKRLRRMIRGVKLSGETIE